MVKSSSASDNPFGYISHAAFAGLNVSLVRGERPDGTYIHISAAQRGLACDCTCLACGARLIVRKGEQVAEHFSHQGSGAGCGRGQETNADIWAKDVLARTKTINTPAVEASVSGLSARSHAPKLMKFENAVLERRLGDIVPDVVLILEDGLEMLVEIRVTHACDDAKSEKIRLLGIATIEVDLRALRTSQDVASIERGLVSQAPRTWLFNAKLSKLQESLTLEAAERERRRDAVRRKQEERARRHAEQAKRELDRRVGQLLAATKAHHTPSDADRETVSRVIESRYGDLIGVPIQSDAFIVDAKLWQAALVEKYLLFDDIRSYELPDFKAREAAGALVHLIRPEFVPVTDRQLRNAVKARSPNFLFPDEAVEHYLDELCHLGELQETEASYELSDERVKWVLGEQQAARDLDRRCMIADDLLDGIMEALPPAEHYDFSVEAWRTRPMAPAGPSPQTIIGRGGEAWRCLESALRQIAAMVNGQDLSIEADLGLPVEAARERQRKLRTERLTREASEREAVIVNAANEKLGAAAENWLVVAIGNGADPRQLARRDTAGLQDALVDCRGSAKSTNEN